MCQILTLCYVTGDDYERRISWPIWTRTQKGQPIIAKNIAATGACLNIMALLTVLIAVIGQPVILT